MAIVVYAFEFACFNVLMGKKMLLAKTSWLPEKLGKAVKCSFLQEMNLGCGWQSFTWKAWKICTFPSFGIV